MTTTRMAFVALGLCWFAFAELIAQQPRDRPPSGSSTTGSIVGTVTTAEGRPIDRAVVTVRTDALPLGSSAITDERGAFAIHQLPAGRMTLTAVKNGFLPGTYGAMRPGRQGTPVTLAAGETLTATIVMTRGAVVTGAIRDERGQPIADVPVMVLDARVAPEAQTEAVVGLMTLGTGSARTDERGVYRVFDLRPGEYVIAAFPQRLGAGDAPPRSTAEVDVLLARLNRRSDVQTTAAADATAPAADPGGRSIAAPIFYPGTPVFAEASRVSLTGGNERAGLDFVVQPVPVASIDGVVTTPTGISAKYQLSITPSSSLPLGLAFAGPRLAAPGNDSHFRYTNLIPGRYRITARGNPTWTNDLPRGAVFGDLAAMLYAVAEVDVAGTAVTGVELRLRPGARFAGRVVLDPAASSNPGLGQLRVTVTPERRTYMVTTGSTVVGDMFLEPRHAVPNANAEFEIAGLTPGRYRVESRWTGGDSRWWLRSVVVNGRDLLDTGFEATPGTDISGVVLTLTDRHTELAGTLQTSAGLPAPEYFVIVFPADETLRVANSRRIRSTRPATDGSFAFADLPPGIYLLAALTDVEPDEWQKPEFLSALVPASVKVTLAEGEKKRQDLRVVR